MATATLTIDGMAKKKNGGSAGKPQGRSPAYTVFARIPPDLGQAFEAYVNSLKPKPSATATLTLMIEEFLAAHGFWPRPSSGDKEGE